MAEPVERDGIERLRGSVFEQEAVDVNKLGALDRHLFIEKVIKHVEHDNLRLLRKIRHRVDNAGVKLPTVEVRYKNLRVEADCEVVQGKPLPTLWNSFKSSFSVFKIPGLNSQATKLTIIDDVSGIIKPGRMTLLLGPPGCGKTTLLKGLSGNLSKSLKVSGEVSYNGYKFEEFVPQKTSAYISQSDLHIPELTVRETLDFSARCQGVGSRADIMLEVSRKEKEAGFIPDPDVDTYMKAISVEGQETTLQTDYILKILGLDICAETLIGDAMRRGISGGQKKRLTTGEMIVGPTKTLFLDEISNGLDSSTTYQIVACLQHFAHISSATIFLALLQPAPETFDLFDDIVMMAEGKVVYHGPRNHVVQFFEDCGFKCPERKGVADFLQEVMSRKDQAQYWYRMERPWDYISVDEFSRKFIESTIGKKLYEELNNQFVKSESHKNAVSFNRYSLSKWYLFKACMSREVLLMRRNAFIYVFKSVQLVITASIAMTVYLRTRMQVDVVHANYFLGALFYALMLLFFDGFPELAMTVARLPVFYKQRDLYFYPAWAYALPATILKVPLSILGSLIWTCLTYYVIGYSPEGERFFHQLIILFALHLAATSLFRFIASTFQTAVLATSAANYIILVGLLFGGFVIPIDSMPVWLKWGFWISPLTYGELSLSLNEFLSPRWQKGLPSNTTLGNETLKARGLDYGANFYWISLGVLFGMTILFNIGFIMTLTYLDPPGPRAIISRDKLSKIQGTEESLEGFVEAKPVNTKKPENGRMVLPFEPLAIVFEDMQYYVDTPLEMKERGFADKQLQLLCDITGAFRPGVLTALMGVSGAGKTTLLDVLAGRKNSGTTKGEIRIGGYPKVQETFARISGYCEQTDVHSPQLTVEESLIFSAWLRLDGQVVTKTKYDFVNEVLATIELDEIKDSLVGLPGDSGLSTEQRKRLTIAVELVANPSIIFMDEPTTGLDARAAAIVMRAVKNVADTGRTIVCTIHQPSIDIFEAFDELLLLKPGGRIIYSGPLGINSSSVIKYFEEIPRVPKIRDNYNPATWMLDVTSTSAEAELGVDFAQVYKSSVLNQRNQELVKSLRSPPPCSKELYFASRFPQNGWGQFKSCFWKQYLSYWRSPSYNLKRSIYALIIAFLLGMLFWDKGTKMDSQQSLFTIFGSMYVAALLLGINNSSSVLPYVSTERTVLYRERYSGMYAPWAYALAQVVVEVPYLLAQSIAFVVITYPMIGYYWSASKIIWYFYTIFCTVSYFNYLGMVLVSMTPSFPVAAILQSAFYTTFTLFSGFFVPRPQIPKWWLWMYYATPTSWTMNALLTSQYGDVQRDISVFGKKQTIAAFVEDYFGYHHDRLALVGVALFLFPVLFASLFTFFIWKLNFQRR